MVMKLERCAIDGTAVLEHPPSHPPDLKSFPFLFFVENGSKNTVRNGRHKLFMVALSASDSPSAIKGTNEKKDFFSFLSFFLSSGSFLSFFSFMKFNDGIPPPLILLLRAHLIFIISSKSALTMRGLKIFEMATVCHVHVSRSIDCRGGDSGVDPLRKTPGVGEGAGLLFYECDAEGTRKPQQEAFPDSSGSSAETQVTREIALPSPGEASSFSLIPSLCV
ncbi:hypothetical protein CEXT_803861 [Caerostris extrusa]|uniref:Uncharacterized protein n=1 Tax=Caerostris extrusa TaxID=172846 RepID=A0AAV4Y2Z5_CAEEX|nr:hypothetical protein CEXT_803861 [Caerostris extrusa]